MKNDEFNIVRSTMRELTSSELEIVAGATTPLTTSSNPCASFIIQTIGLTWPKPDSTGCLPGGGDTIFGDDFEDQQ